jgi:hypothetical protein
MRRPPAGRGNKTSYLGIQGDGPRPRYRGLPTEAELNALGDEHWELAGIVREDQRAHFYFKRERLR